MIDSILLSTRAACGVEQDDDSFDTELIPLIESDLFEVTQAAHVGIQGFTLTGVSETWLDFNPEHPEVNPLLATLVGKRVKMLFDPPSGSVGNSLTETINRLEHRLNYQLGYNT